MGTIVKICGLTSEEALDAAIAHGADMAGFIVHEKSPRHISLGLAARLGRRAGARICKVLLTVDAGDALLSAAIAALDPAALQLHGAETAGRVGAIRARFGLPVIKAIGIGSADDLALIAQFETVADLLLLDAKPGPQARTLGGTGKSFDWGILAGTRVAKPWLLAGGLDAANVGSALARTGARGVDVSSGVEGALGIKDGAKIAAFIAAARLAAENSSPAPALT
ncbi:MAG: phosphoribosylanthranilate isomerase [Methylocapsa sp.]|nr:phosphoribosylanthranilate isomerase [Methylocapsa sp.]